MKLHVFLYISLPKKHPPLIFSLIIDPLVNHNFPQTYLDGLTNNITGKSAIAFPNFFPKDRPFANFVKTLDETHQTAGS